MERHVYVYIKGHPNYVLNDREEPMVAKTDADLLDTISLFFLDGDQRITRKTPEYRGRTDIEVAIYPVFKPGQLVINKTTLEVRRVKSVGIHYIVLFNTDDASKAELQRNGYILSNPREVKKDEWIPLDDGTDSQFCEIYHPGSSIGKDPTFDYMEYRGISSLVGDPDPITDFEEIGSLGEDYIGEGF